MVPKISAAILNILGIILEVVGFLIILFAVQAVKPGRGSFSGKWDEARNIMSTLYPRLNYFGVGLVIFGLGLQLVNAIIT
jgi:hypothetical protein